MIKRLLHDLRVAFRAALVTMLLTGLIYPLAVTVVGNGLFSEAANGSILNNQAGEPIGSALIGQVFEKPQYLQARPSAAGKGYDANASAGSNMPVASASFREAVGERVKRLKEANPDAVARIPAELVTASASGLDPHLTPEAAYWQVPRIAGARGVSEERVKALLMELVEKPTLGFIGNERINVLQANITLDRQLGAKPI